MITPSQALIKAVRVRCTNLDVHRMSQPCSWPACKNENARGWVCAERALSIKAALASVLKREPSEEMLRLLQYPPETKDYEERDWYEHWYELLIAQLLRELGLEEER